MSSIEQEQEAFNKKLPELIDFHEGEFAVFHNGEPVGFFKNPTKAYEFALSNYGLDGIFLIQEVSTRSSDISSLTWEVGALVI